MRKVVSVEVEQSGYEFMQHIAKLAGAWKQALADGWQAGQDIPVIVMSVVAEGPGAMANVTSFSAELAEDKLEFIKGLNIGTYDVAKAVIG